MLFLPHNANILLSALIFNSRSLIYTLLLPCYSFFTNQLWQLSVSPMRGDLQTSMLTTTGSRVFFDIKIGDTDAGRVAFELVSFPDRGMFNILPRHEHDANVRAHHSSAMVRHDFLHDMDPTNVNTSRP